MGLDVLFTLIMPHCAFGMIWYRYYSLTHIYTQFDAQNAGNSVSELPDFKFFWGGGTPLAKGVL